MEVRRMSEPPSSVTCHMGKLNGKDPSVWMRSIRWHTYEHKPQDEGDCYLAHEEMVETILIHQLAVRDVPPKRATHTPTTLQVME